MGNLNITEDLVKDLIATQFPDFAGLSIKEIKPNGWDNRSFRVGNEMIARLPSAEGYAAQVAKEQKWLPKLSSSLSFIIPKPIAMGEPGKDYPFNWSIYSWIVGDSANNLSIKPERLKVLASDLGKFLKEFHSIDTTGGPKSGLHNYWRGGDLSVYDSEAKSSIEKNKEIIDFDTANSIWETALKSSWDKDPVWVHGDLSIGNIILEQDRLKAVIDFGCLGIGDPACDLMIAYTLFDSESRAIFKNEIGLDENTWERGRGWMLWKCLQPSGPESKHREKIIKEILLDLS